ncbi:hypothetical protein [Micromonospora zamorensis]|uniref:hypothetical protein n=1 Tax=Micromonospora zamorensis TaxID=709883 RepID=UPI00081F9034|nr:hypothetical protein [Micromonospora zamorensis]SCG49275.1 Uncharacterized membrane protein [Micromonospora zamorensis]
MRIRPGIAELMAVASVVAAVTALPSAASAAEVAEVATRAAGVGPPCVREDLRLPAGSWQRITVMHADPSGRFQIAHGTDTSWREHLIRWDAGVPTNLGPPTGSPTDVNEQGDFVGNTSSEDGLYRSTAWRYSAGQVTALPGLPGSVQTIASAIAGDGTVVGWVRFADGQPTAVTWAADNSVRVLPGSGDSRAIDVDVDGTVIGYLSEKPVRWAPNAQPELLPGYAPGPDTTWALTGISAGVVVGQEYTGSRQLVLAWAPGTAPVLLAEGAVAHAVNARGSVAYEQTYENQQWLRQDGIDRALPFGPSPYSVADITGLSDDDVAYGNHYSTPVRWICG